MTDDASPENLRKFLESDDPALVRMGLSLAKGAGVPEDLYETIIKLSILAPEEEIQKAAQSLVNLDESDMLTLFGIDLVIAFCWVTVKPEEGNREAAKDLVDGIGIQNIPESRGWLESLENWDDSDMLSLLAIILEKLKQTERIGPVISRIVEIGGSEATDLLLSELSLTEVGEKYWEAEDIIEGLGKIGDEKALNDLDSRFRDECEYITAFYIENTIPTPNTVNGPRYKGGYLGFVCYETASAIADIGGNKAKEILLSYVMLHEPWWASYVAVRKLESLGWKPENEDEKIAYLIAKHDWNGCKEMGEVAIIKAIESLVDPIYVLEGNWVSREIVEAVNSFGKEKVVEILKGITNSWDRGGDYSIETLESMIQDYAGRFQ